MSYTFFGDASEVIKQWPMLSTWATIFYTFAHILPGNLVRCYIFRRHLRYPFVKVFAGLLLLIAIECLCQIWYGRIFSPRVGFFFYLVYFFYLCTMTLVPFYKQFCLILPMGLTWYFLTYVAYTTEYYAPLFPVPFFETGLVLLFETLLCLYPFWFYSERFVAPLLAEDTVPGIWKPLAFLGFVILALSVLTSPFNEDRTLPSFFARLAASLGGLTGTLIALYAVHEAVMRRQLNAQLAITQEMRQAEREHYANVEEIERETWSFQQKLQAFVRYSEDLLSHDDYDTIDAYANRFLETKELSVNASVCGNELVNALVSYWQGIFQRLGVNTCFEISLGSRNPIDPLHMTAILGNLLRNAAEALARVPDGQERRLRLMLQATGGTLVIALDNSFDGQLRQDEEQNYLSAKRDFVARGVGLDSIRSSVEQCGGTFMSQVQDRNFESSVVLPIQEQPPNNRPFV